jgi:hypothetical protein
MGFIEVAPWNVQRNSALSCILDEIVLALAIARALPRAHGAFAQRLARVGKDESEVDADDASEAAARLAGADRGVERKEARRRIGVLDVAIGTVQIRREAPHAAVRVGAGLRGRRIALRFAGTT